MVADHRPALPKSGSSPRLRGTCWHECLLSLGQRFIPAPAGNIRRHALILRPQTVHPRACGEHIAYPILVNGDYGSSPRLRGTYICQKAQEFQRRFIPAPAGNMNEESEGIEIETVHPRACGEHFIDIRV